MKKTKIAEWLAMAAVLGVGALLALPHVREVTEDTDQAACRRSMHLLAAAQELAYARGDGYGAPSDEVPSMLSEAGGRMCPAVPAKPVLTTTLAGYTIVCPSQGEHGSIRDGALSWVPSR